MWKLLDILIASQSTEIVRTIILELNYSILPRNT